MRYIGKTARGAKARWKRHISNAASGGRTHCYAWIRLLLSAGVEPVLEQLGTAATDAEAAEMERASILEWRQRGAKLTNLTEGGEGVLGLKHSAETLLRFADKMRGRPHTQEHRDRIAAGLRRNYESDPSRRARQAEIWRGRSHAPETRAKLSAAKRGIAPRADVLAKSWAANTGHPQSAEANRKRSESVRRTWADPELRAAASRRSSAREAAKRAARVVG